MKKYILIFISFSIQMLTYAQTPAFEVLDVNNITAGFNTNGALFTDFDSGQFSAGGQASTINSAGIWIGGLDPSANLKGAFQLNNENGVTDFRPGILDPLTGGHGLDFNKIWKVNREDVEAYLAAWQVSEDTGVSLEPEEIPEPVRAWPGRGNPYFSDVNGFDLPNTLQGLAPFWDHNGDGFYDPGKGDYPILGIRGLDQPVIPDQMIWFAFNDALIHTQSSCLNMNTEIQVQAFAYTCSDNEVLDNTVFVRYKTINRGVEALDSTFFGAFTNMSIGCPEDDYFGTIPGLNTLYVYNSDNEDDLCGDIDGFGENPPVQALTLLRGPFTDVGEYTESYNLMGFSNDDSSLGTPESCIDFYNYLNGSDLDGFPLGFNGAMYSGNPNNPAEQSELSDNTLSGQRNVMGTYDPIHLIPGAVNELIVAYTFYQKPGASNLQNVQEVYSNSWQFEEILANNFLDPCTIDLCMECVWPGDADDDNQVSNLDLLPIGLGYGASGPIRADATTAWNPEEAEDWSSNLADGTNYKNLDCNGDGTIDENDLLVIEGNFGSTNVEPGDVITAPLGEELYLEAPAGPFMEGEQIPIEIFLGDEMASIENLYGIAFSIQYDASIMSISNLTFDGGWISNGDNGLELAIDQPAFNRIDFGATGIDLENRSGFGALGTFTITIKDDIMGISNEIETLLRFVDLRAINNAEDLLDIRAQGLEIVVEGVSTSAEVIDEAAELFTILNNPAQETVEIQIQVKQAQYLNILNLLGQNELQITQPRDRMSIPIKTLSPGIYLVQVVIDGYAQTKKLIIQ